jgi:hypothetical protein
MKPLSFARSFVRICKCCNERAVDELGFGMKTVRCGVSTWRGGCTVLVRLPYSNNFPSASSPPRPAARRQCNELYWPRAKAMY